MNILDIVKTASNGDAISEIADSLGISQDQASGAIDQLMPAIARGIGRNATQTNGTEDLIRAIQNGNHQRYIDNPTVLTQSESIDDGNGILGHIFGNKDTSRAVATKASQNTGLGTTIIKKMLPMVAALAMGALSKNLLGGGNQAQAQPQLTGLKRFLDFDRDGSIADDLLGIVARRFF